MTLRAGGLVCGCVFMLLALSCQDDSKPHCYYKNYGSFGATFGDLTVGHRLSAQLGTKVKSKDIAIGVEFDTMLVTPGYYRYSVASIDSTGMAVDSQANVLTIDGCSSSNIIVTF